MLTMHLICHVNIATAVNLSSDNTDKSSSQIYEIPLTIDKGTKSNVRASLWHLSESHSGYSLPLFYNEKKNRAELHISNHSILCHLGLHGYR